MSTLTTPANPPVHCHSVDLMIPQSGDWSAKVALEGGAVPALGATATLTIGDLAMVGVVVRTGDETPGKPLLWLEGAPGWGSLVSKPISYQSDGGVMLSTALNALSKAAGQTIEQPTDVTIGNYYELVAARTSEPVRYRDALAELVREGILPPWRVDPDGVTRFGTRAGVEVTARATDMGKNPALGLLRIGLDEPLGFLPGNTIGGVPIARLSVNETASKLTANVYTVGTAPTIGESVRRIGGGYALDEIFRTYVVASIADISGRLNLVPPPDAPHLPEMANVEQWGLGGTLVFPAVGAEVLVGFRDARKTKPVVVGWAPGTPISVDIDASFGIRLATGAEPVALAGSLYAFIDMLLSAPFWVPVSSDGGAALQAAWAAYKTTHPTPGPWAATKVTAT